MSIQELPSNFKHFLGREDTRLVGIIVLVGLISFLLGRMSVTQNIVSIVNTAPQHASGAVANIIEAPAPETSAVRASSDPSPQPLKSAPLTQGAGGYVASKNGTKYHLPWCSGAKSIKDENKVWFNTKAEAEAAGYTPAANCKGI